MTAPSRHRYDTIVAGAGPAGIMAAVSAARRGDVLLADASRLPREKSCGGMLHGLSQDFLAAFGGVPDSIGLTPSHVDFRYVDWDRGIRKATDLRFANVDRAGFDEWLLSLLPANVEVADSCGVVGVTQDGGGVSVRFKTADGPVDVECANLIGADGARSAVRRALGVGAARTYVTVQDFLELKGDLQPYFDCIYMREIGDSLAYAYVVPKGPVAIVGSVFYPKTKRPWEKQDAVIGMLRAAMPELGPSVRREAACALYVRSADDLAPGAGRVLLAGEAGGFMSPTSGEGISYALRSGRAAGEAVAVSTPNEVLSAYRRSTRGISDDIRRRLQWLPFMESAAGKYIAGFTPASVVSRVTRGL